MLEPLKKIMTKYYPLLAMMQADFNSIQVTKVKLILLFFLKVCILVTYAFLFANFVANQLEVFMRHTLVAWASLCFAFDGKHVIPFQICS